MESASKGCLRQPRDVRHWAFQRSRAIVRLHGRCAGPPEWELEMSPFGVRPCDATVRTIGALSLKAC